MNEFKVLLQAVLDSKGIGKSDIDKVQKVLDKYHLNLAADLNKSELIKTIKQIIPELEAQLKKITGIDVKINEKDLIKAFGQMEKDASKASKEQEKLIDNMERLRLKTIEARQAEEKRQQIYQSNAINKAQEQLLNVKELQSNGSIDLQFQKTSSSFNQLENLKLSTTDLRNEFTKLKTIYDSLGSSSTDKELLSNFKKFNDQIKLVNNNIGVANTKVSDLDKIKLNNQIKEWRRINSVAENEFGRTLDDIQAQLNNIDNKTDFNNLNNQFSGVKQQASAMGLLGKDLSNTIGSNMKKFFEWTFSSSVVMRSIQSVKDMVRNVIELNTNMTELAKVSDATEKQLDSTFSKSIDSAKELGATVSDVISATADWSRLGYSLEQSEELAKIAVLYKNVGDGIDIDTANKSLVSTLQGFQLDVSDAMRIIDAFNETANNFPIDTAGIGEALQRSAASFYAANTDLEKSIALVTGTNAVVQDPASVGTMWKTVGMRVRSAKSELEQAGEDTEGMVETTAQLRDIIKSMTGFDIMKDKKTFKDIYDIVIGVGREWKNLSDIDQASLLEKLAGKRQGNALSAALNNVDMIEDAYQTATNSAGSAMSEQEKYEQSVQYSLDRLTASLEQLSSTLLGSDILKFFVDLGTTGVESISKIVSALSPLGTIGAIGGGILGAKGLGGALLFKVA